MGRLVVNPRQLVVPGELLAEGMDFVSSSGTYRDAGNIYANKVGLMDVSGRVIRVIPFRGVYIPNKNDIVIGEIVDIGYSSWQVDIGSTALANLSIKEATNKFINKDEDLSTYYDDKDVIIAKLISANRTGAQLTMRERGLHKITEGIIVKINPYKVPRLIGRKGSMINMIKELTNTRIVVGQNGWIWVNGTPEGILKAMQAIKLVDEQGHESGLTDRINEMLRKG